MPATEARHSLEDLATLGKDVFDRLVTPQLRPEDDGKFVALDVDTGDFEIDADDYSAVMRLKTRSPDAETWLIQVGQPATCKMR